MARVLTESEVARVLKVSPSTVHRLFDENRLTGFKWGFEWRTTEDMLQQDMIILTEEASIDAMRNGEYVAPAWPSSVQEDLERAAAQPDDGVEAAEDAADADPADSADEDE